MAQETEFPVHVVYRIRSAEPGKSNIVTIGSVAEQVKFCNEEGLVYPGSVDSSGPLLSKHGPQDQFPVPVLFGDGSSAMEAASAFARDELGFRKAKEQAANKWYKAGFWKRVWQKITNSNS